MPTRFVILHHRLEDSEHWDLMLEHGDSLLTWQLPVEPAGLDCFPMPANRIADHRKAYLTYEGPVSHNRGVVKQIDSGIVHFEEMDPFRIEFTLTGNRLNGRFSLTSDDEGEWTLDNS